MNQPSDSFSVLLESHRNHPSIKADIMNLLSNIERKVYVAFTSREDAYLQTIGLNQHETGEFNYIGFMLQQRSTVMANRIRTEEVELKLNYAQKKEAPVQVQESAEINQEIEYLMNNLDLPISLFKRDDRYWSEDNPKTVMAKQYIQSLHQNEKDWKKQIKKKREVILAEKNQKANEENSYIIKQEEQRKQQLKEKMKLKIQQIKVQEQERKKQIDQSLEFMKKQGKPMFYKIENEFKEKYEIPTLEERKRKLSAIRELRKSVDMKELEQHRKKYEEMQSARQPKKIPIQPPKVSFKSHFHQSYETNMQNSHISNYSTVKSLYQRRKQYATVIKQQHKPTISEYLVNEMNDRLELMQRKRVRKNKKKNDAKSEISEGDSEDEEEEEKEEPEPSEESEKESEKNSDDSDDLAKIGEQEHKNDEYEPTRKERHRLGREYLNYVVSLPKKKRTISDMPNVGSSEQTPTSQMKTKDKNIYLNKYQYDPSKKPEPKREYKNYLKEFQKTHRTIDVIDTAQIRKELTHNGRFLKDANKVKDLDNKIRRVQEKAKMQQQLLRFQGGKRGESMDRKTAVDNAVIDTIKARLAMMQAKV